MLAQEVVAAKNILKRNIYGKSDFSGKLFKHLHEHVLIEKL